METVKDRTKQCTLSDKELIQRCGQWVDKLCKSNGDAWVLRIPVDFNYDPDMLFIELINRFKKIGCQCPNGAKHGETSVMCCNECGKPTEQFWTGV
jgi:hypothetical protein